MSSVSENQKVTSVYEKQKKTFPDDNSLCLYLKFTIHLRLSKSEHKMNVNQNNFILPHSNNFSTDHITV